MVTSIGAIALRGATLLLGILSVALLAPFLGSSDFGRFAVLQAMIAWGGILALGLPDACTGIIAKFHRKRHFTVAKNYLDNAFAVVIASVCTGGVMIFIINISWRFVTSNSSDFLPFILGVGLALFTMPFVLIQASLNADGELTRGTGWAFFTSSITIVSIWSVINLFNVPQPDRLLAVTIAAGLSGLAAHGAMYFIEYRRLYNATTASPHISARRIKTLFHAAYPFIIINGAALAAFQVDRFVSYQLLSSADTAKLDITMKIIGGVYTLYSVPISKLWYTVGKAWNSDNRREARLIMRRTIIRAGLFWTMMLILIPLVIEFIVKVITRGTLTIDDYFFVIMAIAYIAARGIVDIVSISIFATRNQHRTIKTVIAHGLLNVPLSILGCQLFGLAGIMIGQIASLLITSGWRFPIIFWRVTR